MKKLKRAIHNWMLTRIAKIYGYEIVNKWVYFGYNYPSTYRDVMLRTFGAITGKHFLSKFESFSDISNRSAINDLWIEMSDHYRRQFFNALFLDEYVGKVSKKDWRR